MIYITGAAGFIGSNLVRYLNSIGRSDLVLIDNLTKDERWKNLLGCSCRDLIEKEDVFSLVPEPGSVLIHLGAISSSLKRDAGQIYKNNYQYSQRLSNWCAKYYIRFIYASSAAVYGNAVDGNCSPLNPYAYFKHLFDCWQTRQEKNLVQSAGLRFFNVYGPHENHKGRNASVIHHFYREIQKSGSITIYTCRNRPLGYQKRDFVFVEDVVKTIGFFIENSRVSGIYDVGSGSNVSFSNVVRIFEKVLGQTISVNPKELPDSMKSCYQDNTCADLGALRRCGFENSFIPLEEGIKKYIHEYLCHIDW